MSIYSRLHTSAGGRLLTATIGKRKQRHATTEFNIPEGENTRTIYGLIRDGELKECKEVLLHKLDLFPRNRAALSLLGYVCYQMEEFEEAAEFFEQLCDVVPKNESYKLYYAQSLFKASKYEKAIAQGTKLLNAGENRFEFVQSQSNKIIGYSKFEMEDFSGSKKNQSQGLENDPDIRVLKGCILYKEGELDRSLKEMITASKLDSRASIQYNIALMYYRLKSYPQAFKIMEEIIQKGAENHPELSIGSGVDGNETISVGNTLTLRNTSLIETFNLKCAIEYVLQNFDHAATALKEMPPRKESELDAVTLHNIGLLQMEGNPNEGFKKMKHLLSIQQFPEETFPNLLILYCKYSYYDQAADMLAANPQLYKYLTPDLYEFLEAVMEAQTAPEVGYHKLDEIGEKHIERLRKITKEIQESRQNQNAEGIKNALKDFTEALNDYIPVLMHMGRIYWDIENYEEVEKILKKSEEFCGENEIWKLNLAHSYFMQEKPEKFKLAIKYYLELVEKNKQSILTIPAMVLANLCVAYIMTSENESAEELMKDIEKEENKMSRIQPDKPILHLCIVNLVIGTLYCSKGHFEFGISRVIKSLEPYNKKLSTDTWFYAKRCFLSLLESLCKHLIVIKDPVFEEIMGFLDASATYGKEIETTVSSVVDSGGADAKSMSYSGGLIKDFDNDDDDKNYVAKARRTVYYEARTLKALFLEYQYS